MIRDDQHQDAAAENRPDHRGTTYRPSFYTRTSGTLTVTFWPDRRPRREQAVDWGVVHLLRRGIATAIEIYDSKSFFPADLLAEVPDLQGGEVPQKEAARGPVSYYDRKGGIIRLRVELTADALREDGRTWGVIFRSREDGRAVAIDVHNVNDCLPANLLGWIPPRNAGEPR